MEHFKLDTLTGLPLFQGIGKSELEEFSATVPHRFRQYGKGQTLVKQDEPCQQFVLAIRGTLEVHSQSDNRRISFHETQQAPTAVQPEALYGIMPRYTRSYVARTDVKALVIPKDGIAKLFSHFEVFRLNLVNLLSTTVYRQGRWLWHDLAGSTEKRIIHFVHARCVHPAGEKVVEISMAELGRQINESRMNVSKALNKLQEANLILLQRRKIIIPALEKLIQAR